MPLRTSVAILALALSACGQASNNQSAPANSTNAVTSNGVQPASPPSPAGGDKAAAGATAAPGARAELTGNGIIYRGDGTGAPETLTFGTAQQEATGRLVTITSESTEYFPANRAGCSETSFGETTAYFQAGRFIGYSTSSGDLKTAAGIGVGSTQAQLEAAYNPELNSMEDGGTDFIIRADEGELRGVIRDGRVISMAGGEICGR
jgi:hypothetical protein